MEPIPEIMKKIYVPTPDEIVSRITRRKLSLERGGKYYESELRLMGRVYDIITGRLLFVKHLPSPKSMPPFYAELAELACNGMYGKCVYRLRYMPRILRRIYETYRYRILASENPREASRLRREAVGRMISVLRREKCLGIVKRGVIALSRAPGIVMDEPKIIIAGAPSSGKSTLLSRLSRARPEIASYPFTTKSIMVGHMFLGETRYQLIDTPGILDRPLEERNEIEMKAILAIRHLADSLIFLVDPSPQAYYDLKQQFSLLDNTITRITGRERIIVGVNKADLLGVGEAETIVEELRRRGYENVYVVSAETGLGLEPMVEAACRIALTALRRTTISRGHGP